VATFSLFYWQTWRKWGRNLREESSGMECIQSCQYGICKECTGDISGR
jgi:hypothetical protein